MFIGNIFNIRRTVVFTNTWFLQTQQVNLYLFVIYPQVKLQEHASKRNNKRYLKRKTDHKKVANKSASSIAVVDRAKRELQLC